MIQFFKTRTLFDDSAISQQLQQISEADNMGKVPKTLKKHILAVQGYPKFRYPCTILQSSKRRKCHSLRTLCPQTMTLAVGP